MNSAASASDSKEIVRRQVRSYSK